MAKRRRLWALVGIVALDFAVRVSGLEFQSLWRDEVDALLFATEPLADLLHTFIEPGQNGPLYFLLLRPWLFAAGTSEFSLRFFSVCFGVLTAPLLYRLGRRLFPLQPNLALLGALLAATSPYLVWYGQEGKMYTLATFLVVLSMERYLAALAKGGWERWLVYVVATSLAFYVHLIAVLIIPAQVLAFVIVGRRNGFQRWKPWLACLVVLTVPYLPLLAWQMPLLLEPAETGFRFVPLPQMLFSLLSSHSLGVVQVQTPWSLAAFAGLLLVVVALLVRGRQRTPVWILACWLLVPVLVLFALTLVRPIYTARYLIFVLPAYLLLLACALAAISRRSRLVALLLTLCILALNGWGIWLQARTSFKTDFRSATRYVSSQLAPEDLILFQIPYGRHSFDYYFEPPKRGLVVAQVDGDFQILLPLVTGGGGGLYRWAEGPYTNAGMSEAQVSLRMADLVDGSQVVWLMATEVALWDKENQVQGWLDGHARLADKAEFVRVTVYRYELP